MRLGYFGGSFDPPHFGHLAVACAARDRFALDRVLLAPTARQPLKPDGPEAPFADRLRMTELLCSGQPRLEASAIDGPQPGNQPNYTAHTLRRLRAALDQDASGTSGCRPRTGSASPPAGPEVFAIVGADAFLGIRKWREPEALLQLAEWIVVSRPGFPLSTLDTLGLTPAQRARVHLLDGIAVPISATDLRARLHTGQDCAGMIPPGIMAYADRHLLYRRGRV